MNREPLHRESTGGYNEMTARGGSSSFEDLDVYQAAREFRKAMYRVARRLPDIEKFVLAPQVRAAAVSLTNNIAEAHGRYHYRDQVNFMLHARGSDEELLDDLNTCEDENYLPSDEISALKAQGWRVRQLIDGYIRYLRSQTGRTREEPSADVTNLDLTNYE